MKIRTSEIIAGFITTIVFVVLLAYLFDVPNALPELPSISNWMEQISEKLKSNPTTQRTKNQKPPTVRSSNTTNRVVDEFKGVKVYYNGRVGNVQGRNVTDDGYNLGLRYQCVEFVKRFYYKYYKHKMPNSYGNAKDFFDANLYDGAYNKDRGLTQYSNPSSVRPKEGDLLVFGPTRFNQYGHVAIISRVESDRVEFVQQNPGRNNPSREWILLQDTRSGFFLQHENAIGWLRK